MSRAKQFFSVVAVILFVSSAHAKDTVINGVIEMLDPELGFVVLRVPPDFVSKSFNLAKPDLPVTNALGRPLKLADLETKHRVALTLGDQGDVTAIRLDADCIWGTLLKLEPQERLAHVRIGSSERNFALSMDAAVLAEGKPFDVAQLKPGQAFKGILSSDGKHLIQVHVGKGVPATSPYGKFVHLGGVLIKADHDRKRLQIVTMPERYQLKELEYEPWAEIQLVHSSLVLRRTGIAALQPYCKVYCQLEEDTDQVVQVTVEVPTLSRRRVEKVERDARRLTLRIDNKLLTVTLAADAVFRTPEGLATWDAVADQALVTCGFSLDGREVIFLYIWSK